MNRYEEVGPVATAIVWTVSLAPFVIGAAIALFVLVQVVKFFWTV